MSNFRKHDMKTKKLEDLVVGSGDTKTVGEKTIISAEQARFVRIRVRCSALALGGGSLTAEICHGPSQSETSVATSKTVSVTTVNTDYYIIINDSDTGLVPLMPYIKLKITSASGATCTVSDCDIFRR